MKPDYKVPSMTDIEKVRGTNGFKMVSTFSGCGGSCLGFEMEGFEVVWASEFVEAARDTYRLNHPSTILDDRDIRLVQAEDILNATGLSVGELDVFEGSPPCASFSIAGKRESKWGEVSKYSETEQQTDDLFFEFARLLKGLQPKVFVAENVAGLVGGTAKGYFKMIMRELKDCGYKVEAQLLNAKWLGVPQARKRVIIMGVRNDLDAVPVYPKPLQYSYSIKDACPWITGGGLMKGSYGAISRTFATWSSSFPSRTVMASGISSAKDNEIVVDPPQLTKSPKDQNEAWLSYLSANGHPSMTDPNESILAGISRYAIGREWLRHRPKTTAGGNVPSEARLFTIPEIRRLCGFPDDFQLTGNFAQRWERMGRAVPPVMMSHVARSIRDNILNG
jgi:DNA (cytosine-5)-methyltransferase 1